MSASGVSATGGNVTNTVDNYRIHVFTNSATAGSFTVSDGNLACDILIVGGGGGGGWNYGGGGGGGSVILTNKTLTSRSYPIVVGIGGATAGTETTLRGVNGGLSSAFSFTATGGGGGASYYAAARNAGTGGGGSGQTTPGGTGTAPGGNGGNGLTSPRIGGGGGGARGNGQAAVNPKGGDGGVGVSSDISGAAVLYGGGGGGGARADADAWDDLRSLASTAAAMAGLTIRPLPIGRAQYGRWRGRQQLGFLGRSQGRRRHRDRALQPAGCDVAGVYDAAGQWPCRFAAFDAAGGDGAGSAWQHRGQPTPRR